MPKAKEYNKPKTNLIGDQCMISQKSAFQTPTLTFLGGAGTVTGSCTLLTIGNEKILIDCGTVQGERDAEPIVLPCKPSELSAIILTHGHLDHVGSVPLLVERGFTGPIYGHYATCDIVPMIWNDSIKLLGEEEAGYDAETIKQCLSHLVPLGYNDSWHIGETQCTLHDAGHIIGSSHVSITGEGCRVLFSGDIGPCGAPLVRDPFTGWNPQEPFDAVIIESTYGDRRHKNRSATVEEFKSIVMDVVKKRGVLLIPAFAVGRTQEILYHLNSLVETGAIPPIPVFVDSPMASEMTSLYSRCRDCFDSETREMLAQGDKPLAFKGLTLVQTPQQSNAIYSMRKPFIVIAGSGMCTGGRIVNHLAHYLPDPSTTVMIVGWQGPHTLGRALVDKRNTVFIKGKNIPVKATVATLGGFSAHADQRELLAWAASIPGENIHWFVNHGEPLAAVELATALENRGLGEARAVLVGDVVTVIKGNNP